jgi:hypothetical protein
MHALAAVHVRPPMPIPAQQTSPGMHWVMPHKGPCIPASLLPLLLLPLAPLLLEPAPLLLPLAPLLLPLLAVVPLLLVLPLFPLLLPPLPLLELPLPLLEPLLPLLMPPLPLPLLPPLPPSSPGAVDEVPPHASGDAMAMASDPTKRNEIVFILHLLGPRETMEVKLSPLARAISRDYDLRWIHCAKW